MKYLREACSRERESKLLYMVRNPFNNFTNEMVQDNLQNLNEGLNSGIVILLQR